MTEAELVKALTYDEMLARELEAMQAEADEYWAYYMEAKGS